MIKKLFENKTNYFLVPAFFGVIFMLFEYISQFQNLLNENQGSEKVFIYFGLVILIGSIIGFIFKFRNDLK